MRVFAGEASLSGGSGAHHPGGDGVRAVADPKVLTQECFGPTAIVVPYGSEKGLLAAAGVFDGQLTLREDSPWRLPRRVAGVLQPA